MITVSEAIQLLGKKARDKVTGFVGVVECASFDLYGCIQVVLKPPVNDKGEMADGKWFDVNRIEIAPDERVMPMPQFAKPFADTTGPAEKPRQ